MLDNLNEKKIGEKKITFHLGTQILREINFDNFRISKTTNLTHLKAYNADFGKIQLSMLHKLTKINIHTL